MILHKPKHNWGQFWTMFYNNLCFPQLLQQSVIVTVLRRVYIHVYCAWVMSRSENTISQWKIRKHAPCASNILKFDCLILAIHFRTCVYQHVNTLWSQKTKFSDILNAKNCSYINVKYVKAINRVKIRFSNAYKNALVSMALTSVPCGCGWTRRWCWIWVEKWRLWIF